MSTTAKIFLISITAH